MARTRKRTPRKSKRIDGETVFSDLDWSVLVGELKPTVSSAAKSDHLFKYVAEKLPSDSLGKSPHI